MKDETPRQAQVHKVLEQSAAYLTNDFWAHLFLPLRDMLISRLKRLLPRFPVEDVEDITDEIIFRLYKYYDVAALDNCSSEEQRRKSFYSFVSRTMFSVISDTLRQKGLTQLPQTTPDSSHKTAPIRNIPVDLINTAFDALKPDAQQLLRYKILDGMTYREIQNQYAQHGKEITIDALKMRTLRSMTELRRILNELNEPAKEG